MNDTNGHARHPDLSKLATNAGARDIIKSMPKVLRMADPVHSPSDSVLRRRPSSYLHKACKNCRQPSPTTDAEELAGVVDTDTLLSGSPSEILLSDPYSPSGNSQSASYAQPWIAQYPMQVKIALTFPLDPSLKASKGTAVGSTRINVRTQRILTSQFDAQYRFSRCGLFFLEPLRFRESLLLPQPFGHPDRPAPGLLGAVYIWIHNLSSNSSQFIYTEAELLALTIQNLAHDLSAVHHPNLILHTIQAEVLLSYYYMNAGRLLDGMYHCGAAVSLASCAGIDKIGAPPRISNPRFPFSGVLIDPADELEATERINAFWGLLMLNNLWVAASGLPSRIPGHIIEVFTPWPTDGVRPAFSERPTVAQFLSGEDHPDGLSAFALVVKSSVLLERVIAFYLTPGSSNVDQFRMLEGRLETFQTRLPNLARFTSTAEAEYQTALLTRCLTNVAIIRLHEPRNAHGDESIDKARMAAGRVVSDVNEALLLEWQFPHPVLGPLISTVCNFYIAHLPNFPEGATQIQPLLSFLSHLAPLSQMIRR
ncbi:hypothetical protein B0H13DRAFT_1868484 [Mycena leptocephala]|nr:hypothetical protein B0H13DRAFT_1868484 [Mycena leptocephala]